RQGALSSRPKYSPAGGVRNWADAAWAHKSSGLAGLKLGIEQTQAMGERVAIHHAVEILEQERQRLAFVQPRIMCEAAQATIAIFRHGDGKAAGQTQT